MKFFAEGAYTETEKSGEMEQPPVKKPPKQIADIETAERFVAPLNEGLTAEQIEKRVEEGLVNIDTSKKGKSVAGIILSNVFTFFNMIYIAIAVVLFCYGQFANCMFLAVIVANTLIAIIQEIKSKKTLDKLNLVTVPKVVAVRQSLDTEIPVSELVLDDVIKLGSGAQISADSVVLDGFVEVNESILTGESEAVTKRKGETLYAGSFIVSGSCTARVDKVGRYNYIAGLTGRAKKYGKPHSEMLRALRIILIFIAVLIVPMTLCLWKVNAKFYADPLNWDSLLPQTEHNVLITVLNKTSGSIISMIPAGPFLLTSVALAVSVIRLAKRKTMVQELYCIEMLARVNCLCLDKTGTITDGTMRVIESIDLRPAGSSFTVREIMGSFNSALKDGNMTSGALKKFFGSPKNPPLKAVRTVPFSSSRKLSAVSFQGQGTYILGAPEFVLKTPNQRVNDLVKKYSAEGLRVLLLAHSSTTIYDNETLPAVRRPVAVIVIEDHIRSDAAETIKWFKQNGVKVKVISGDNPVTVSYIAGRVGVEDYDKYVSLEGMTDAEVTDAAGRYAVFGRVSPDQKALLVKALKAAGHTVAMTGDGVNDILAMKESDCSVSLAGGSDAARNVSHLVLMDDSFAALPGVVAEGRRVVNNIQSATSMYFMKTIYIVVINVMLIVLDLAFGKTLSTPYESIQIFLLETVIVGLPTTLLALQPNHSLIKGRFLSNVLRRCFPPAITFILGTVSLYLLQSVTSPSIIPGGEQLSTLISVTYTMGGFFALYYACKPFNKWKWAMYLSIGVIVVAAMVFFPSFWRYSVLTREQILLLLVEILAVPPLLFASIKLFGMDCRLPKLKKK